MIILGIETSCDETSVGILNKLDAEDRIQILSNVISSSASLQAKYGGIIPEQAAREQLKAMIPVIEEALLQANISPKEIDAIAVTQGPGLIGSLLIGVETAKVLATIWNKPLIPINHLLGHLYANWIDLQKEGFEFVTPKFPSIGLLVSGGHTDIVLFKGHGDYKYLGGTRDDAAGECFDKCARVLGFAYPGGPKISKLAESGNPKALNFPRPMSDSHDFDFSFSGLKTAFSNQVEQLKQAAQEELTDSQIADLAASLEQAIIDIIVKKVVKAAQDNNIEQIIVAGGVAANKKLTGTLRESFTGTVLVPPPILCTDNGAMIAAAAFFNGEEISPLSLQANPNLSLQNS